MIVADAGYALLLAGLVTLYRKRLGQSEAGRRWKVMLYTLAGATGIYGIMAGSYFGVTPPPGSLPGKLHILDLGNFTVMMALSVVIGAVHVAGANVMDGLRYPTLPQRLPSFGWATAIMGGLVAWGGMQLQREFLFDGGIALLVTGLALVVVFAGHGAAAACPARRNRAYRGERGFR
jgi:V/A-type H+-transporting ATPase subunit I